MNRFRVYTGPCIVAQVAVKLREAGVRVEFEGTEHVYVKTALNADELTALLGPTWSWRDVRALTTDTFGGPDAR